MIEGTDMNQIEKVARAFPALWNLVQYHKSGGHSGSGSDRTLANALRELSAIAAMPVQAEPVAWMYEYHPKPPETRRGAVEVMLKRTTYKLGRRWTETPLYAFPTPPAGGSDAE